MFVFETQRLTNPLYIVNFPTKRHWRGNSRIEDIEAGLKDLVKVIRARDIRSIAVPPLGSGLGGLKWNVVRARIEEGVARLQQLGRGRLRASGAPETDVMARSRQVPRMTPERAAMVGLMYRYLNGLLDLSSPCSKCTS